MKLFHEEAEKSVIGGLLFNFDDYLDVFEILKPKYFHFKKYSKIFEVILRLYQSEKEVNALTVEEELKFESQNFSNEMAELNAIVVSASLAKSYAEIIKEKFIRRSLVKSLTHVADLVNNEEIPTQAVLKQFEKSVFEVSNEKYSQGLEPVSTVIARTIQQLDNMIEGEKTRVPSGFKSIDKHFHGFRNGTLNIIAARPGMGKSALALDIAKNSGVNVALFSIEMGAEEMGERMISADSGINSKYLRNPESIKDNYRKIVEAGQSISKRKIWLDGSPSKSPLELLSQCKRLKAKEGLGLVIVDYLQFMEIEGKQESKRIEITNISRTLKQAAKVLDVPIIALSQLNRDCEKRLDKRPILADIRESGDIEQDADMVWFIYRDVIYNGNSSNPNLAEILVRKNRSGRLGIVKLEFIEELTTFKDYPSEKIIAGPSGEF